jgi:hypothetical protein
MKFYIGDVCTLKVLNKIVLLMWVLYTTPPPPHPEFEGDVQFCQYSERSFIIQEAAM